MIRNIKNILTNALFYFSTLTLTGYQCDGTAIKSRRVGMEANIKSNVVKIRSNLEAENLALCTKDVSFPLRDISYLDKSKRLALIRMDQDSTSGVAESEVGWLLYAPKAWSTYSAISLAKEGITVVYDNQDNVVEISNRIEVDGTLLDLLSTRAHPLLNIKQNKLRAIDPTNMVIPSLPDYGIDASSACSKEINGNRMVLKCTVDGTKLKKVDEAGFILAQGTNHLADMLENMLTNTAPWTDVVPQKDYIICPASVVGNTLAYMGDSRMDWVNINTTYCYLKKGNHYRLILLNNVRNVASPYKDGSVGASNHGGLHLQAVVPVSSVGITGQVPSTRNANDQDQPVADRSESVTESVTERSPKQEEHAINSNNKSIAPASVPNRSPEQEERVINGNSKSIVPQSVTVIEPVPSPSQDTSSAPPPPPPPLPPSFLAHTPFRKGVTGGGTNGTRDNGPKNSKPSLKETNPTFDDLMDKIRDDLMDKIRKAGGRPSKKGAKKIMPEVERSEGASFYEILHKGMKNIRPAITESDNEGDKENDGDDSEWT